MVKTKISKDFSSIYHAYNSISIVSFFKNIPISTKKKLLRGYIAQQQWNPFVKESKTNFLKHRMNKLKVSRSN